MKRSFRGQSRLPRTILLYIASETTLFCPTQEQGNVQRNRRRHTGARIRCVWQDVGRRRNQQNIVKGKCLANLHKIILLLQVSYDSLLFHDPAEKERGFLEKFKTEKIMMFNFAQKPSSNEAQRKRAYQPKARLDTIRNQHEHTWL